MSFWSAQHLDLNDHVNLDIWARSPEIQARVRDGNVTAGADVLQGRVDGDPLPWVPDLVGKQWKSKDSVFVVGSAYSPFVAGGAGRDRCMSLSEYTRATGAADFQSKFLSSVVQGDRSYYGPLARLLGFVVGDADRVVLTDLVRACFIRSEDGMGGDKAVKADPDLFMRYARLNFAWTWTRLRVSNSSTILALGSIAEHGLLELLVGQGLRVEVHGQPGFKPHQDRPVTEYASGMTLGRWLDQGTWWEVTGRVDGRARMWKVLPVYHPAWANKNDPGYGRTRSHLMRMMGAVGAAPKVAEPTARRRIVRPMANSSPPVSSARSAARSPGTSVVGMHFVCRDDMNVVDHGDGTFDTGVWKVAMKHCDTVQYVALHQSKQERSYRQGRVVSWRTTVHEGNTRIIFTVEADRGRRIWSGGGSGEKGYARK